MIVSAEALFSFSTYINPPPAGRLQIVPLDVEQRTTCPPLNYLLPACTCWIPHPAYISLQDGCVHRSRCSAAISPYPASPLRDLDYSLTSGVGALGTAGLLLRSFQRSFAGVCVIRFHEGLLQAVEVWIWVYSVMVHGRSATPDQHHLFTSAGAVDNFVFFLLKHAAPSLPHIPITRSAKIRTSLGGSKPSQRDQNVRRRREQGLLFPPRLCLPYRARYKRLMEWKALIDRRSNCVIRIVDAHKKIQEHKSVCSREPWKPVQELLIGSKTLFTKSSPRRVQRAAVLIVVFVVNETVEDHSATDRPTLETRSPHSLLYLPEFHFIQNLHVIVSKNRWSFLIYNRTLLVLKTLFSDTSQFLSNWPQTIILHHFYLFFAITCPDLLQLIIICRDLFNPMRKINNFSLCYLHYLTEQYIFYVFYNTNKGNNCFLHSLKQSTFFHNYANDRKVKDTKCQRLTVNTFSN